jgi:hypothetical protein
LVAGGRHAPGSQQAWFAADARGMVHVDPLAPVAGNSHDLKHGDRH